MTVPFHHFRVFLFAFRLLKIESNHEHVLSWARKIHTTVSFHYFRVFLFSFRLLKIESNHEHELSWARKIHMTVPFFIHTSSSSLTHEEVPPRLLALRSILSAAPPLRSPLFRVFCSLLPFYHSLSLPQPIHSQILYRYDPFTTSQSHMLPDHPRHHTLNKGSLSPPTLLAQLFPPSLSLLPSVLSQFGLSPRAPVKETSLP